MSTPQEQPQGQLRTERSDSSSTTNSTQSGWLILTADPSPNDTATEQTPASTSPVSPTSKPRQMSWAERNNRVLKPNNSNDDERRLFLLRARDN